MSFEGDLKTRLLQQECHFTWSLREEDFNLLDLQNRLEEQIRMESGKNRVTRAYSSFGFIHYLHGDLPAALTNLQKSVQLAKEYYKETSDEFLIVTYGDLAWLHYYMKEFSQCEDYLRLLERTNGKCLDGFTYSMPLEVLREKGWAFLKFSYKYYNAAKECFRQALEMIPHDSDLNTGYAIALYRTTTENPDSQDSPTIQQLQKAIKLNTDDAVLLVLLALRNVDQKNDKKDDDMKKSHTELRIKMVISALLKSPENPHVMRYAAKFFRELESLDMAINLLKKALQDSPGSAFIHHQLALCYKNKKYKADGNFKSDLKLCIDHLKMAVSLRPSFIIAMADLAQHYGLDGSISEAERLFEQAFKEAIYRKQHLQSVYCSYGKYQLNTKHSEQLAIQNFMQGLRLQPESAEGKMCESRLKRVAECRIKKLKDPNDSTACYIQGFIHEVAGKTLQAAEFYEKALRNGLAVGESILLTEIRIWFMDFKEKGTSVVDLLFEEESKICDEGQFGDNRLKIVRGKLKEKSAYVVEIDICDAKRILKWERCVLTPGPHAVLLAFRLDHGEFTKKTKEILEDLEFLGEKFWNHVIVVFTEGDCSINEYTGAQREVLEWIFEKCGYKYYISGSAPEMILRMIRRNNSMHLLLPEISDGASQSPSEVLRGPAKKDLFTPEIIVQDGQTKYRLRCSNAGWFQCEFTQVGFNMLGEGEVLYNTVLQGRNCPALANCYPAGPLYDIKCVQGELSQLKLPHCETSIEDAHHSVTVIRFSNHIVDILKPENVTRTHVTVSIQGTSSFWISKILNWFKNRIYGQVMLFYQPSYHRLHVYLQPRNVNPKEVKKLNKNYQLIQSPCDCMLKLNCTYSMSCDTIDEHGRSLMPVKTLQPVATKFICTVPWEHLYPTFDIKLPDGVMNVKLWLKKGDPKKGIVKDVWNLEVPLEEYKAEKSKQMTSSDEQFASFLLENKSKLIQRVRNVDPILDDLDKFIEPEEMSEIRAMTTSQKKTRAIYDITDKQGLLSKQTFFDSLHKNETILMKDMTTDND
ncbi:interferon-induced protein with tetratricopeptide repeats 5 [Xyrauchen texanus]|uniref:interferon-induced protein with tetratricopeptide repeats 5 n=1 Tax=Xyrauchen texanus TaxID=154827 RepID=UPI0022426F7E|nr:interferon-induced protein with tetratricopeptide repeats 5 [Xyrauchen texanus]